MAKTKITKVSQETLKQYLKKPEMWVGLFVLVALFTFGIYSVSSKVVAVLHAQKKQPVVIAQTSDEVVQKTEEEKLASSSAMAKEEQPKVTRLADTSGAYEEVVQKGDSFWRISKRVCGSGIYYESIKAQNGYSEYQALQPGDVVIVNCSL